MLKERLSKKYLLTAIRQSLNLETAAITVAIVGSAFLSGCNRYNEMHFQAKRTEIARNLSSIKEALDTHNAEHGEYIEAAPHPTGTPGPGTRPWADGNEGFETIGWRPEGDARGTYSVSIRQVNSDDSQGDFVITGTCDMDGDGVFATYTATKSIDPVMVTNSDIY